MARKRDRIFALVMVVAFAFTTVGVSVALIWKIVDENKKQNAGAARQLPNKPTEEAPSNPNSLKGKSMQDFTPVSKVEALQIIDLKPGTGDEVTAGAKVTVDYTGALAANGKVFESSLDSGKSISFGLDEVIKGWGEGLVGMKVGGKRRLVIPADKAYGASSPSPDIPANSDLVFDITLHAVNK